MRYRRLLRIRNVRYFTCTKLLEMDWGGKLFNPVHKKGGRPGEYEPKGISDDGMTIVGEGVNPLGFDEGWVAVVPEPGVAPILMLGAGAMAAGKRHLRLIAGLGSG